MVDYHVWSKLWMPLFVAAAVLLGLCFVPHIGLRLNGSSRWVHLGPLIFQPSEVGKLAAIVALAWWFTRFESRSSQFLHGFIFPMMLIGVLMLLIVREEDLGTTLLIGATMVAIMFVAGSNPLYMVVIAVAGVGGILYLATHMSERMARLVAFLDLAQHKEGAGLQQWEALKAFGSGGVWGLGLGESVEKMQYLPYAHTDFIFPIIGEELGLRNDAFRGLCLPDAHLERCPHFAPGAGPVRDVARVRGRHEHRAPGVGEHRHDHRVAAEQRDAAAVHQFRRVEPVSVSRVYRGADQHLSPGVRRRRRAR